MPRRLAINLITGLCIAVAMVSPSRSFAGGSAGGGGCLCEYGVWSGGGGGLSLEGGASFEQESGVVEATRTGHFAFWTAVGKKRQLSCFIVVDCGAADIEERGPRFRYQAGSDKGCALEFVCGWNDAKATLLHIRPIDDSIPPYFVLDGRQIKLRGPGVFFVDLDRARPEFRTLSVSIPREIADYRGQVDDLGGRRAPRLTPRSFAESVLQDITQEKTQPQRVVLLDKGDGGLAASFVAAMDEEGKLDKLFEEDSFFDELDEQSETAIE